MIATQWAIPSKISIHALREEGDSLPMLSGEWIDISIHALREEGDLGNSYHVGVERIYFYPRPPRGGRRNFPARQQPPLKFLSTPSARRATCIWRICWPPTWTFLSTPSARRATGAGFIQSPAHIISIHALREEGDGTAAALAGRALTDFYPRPPRGGRQQT